LVEVVLVDNGPGLDFETYHDEKETLGIELIKHLLSNYMENFLTQRRMVHSIPLNSQFRN
jgi:hypothetical protein